MVLENAKVIALTGNNAFSVKKLLSVDDLTTNYLVYSPCVYNRPDDNWLLDVELYSKEFRTEREYPWNDWNVVLRHTDNQKWYGLIMEVSRDKLVAGFW